MRKALWILGLILGAQAFSYCVFAQGGEAAGDTAIYAEADKLFQKGKYADVLKELSKLSERQRRDLPVEVSYWTGVSWYELGERSFSEWHLLRASSEHPSSDARFDALTRLAQISRAQNKWERALAQLAAALDCAPSEGEFKRIVFLIGDIQQQNGDYDGALRSYVQLLGAYPELFLARVKSLWAMNRAGRFAECIASATSLLEQAPVQDRAEIIYLIASSHRQMQNFPKAVERYDQLLRAFPADRLAEDARYELALCQLHSGDIPAAVRRAEEVLRADASRAERLRYVWLLADAQAQLSQWQTAKELYQQAMVSSAERATAAQALRRMIDMAQKQRRVREVEELQRELREQYPEEVKDSGK